MTLSAKCIECGQLVDVRNPEAYKKDNVQCKDHYKESSAKTGDKLFLSPKPHSKSAEAVVSSIS